MRRSITHLAAGVASIAAIVFATAGGAAASPGSGVLIPTHPGIPLPLQGGTVDSLNWSGYAVHPRGRGVTAVAGSFIVPAAGLIPPGFAATWTGIGGYKTKDLIQAGVAEQSLPSNPVVGPQYFAWYELLPNSETQIKGCRGAHNCAVKPGEKVTVKIRQVSSAAWRISIVDAGHWRWSKVVKYKSSRSSAEWILEAPTVIAQTFLAPVGTVHFGPTGSYTVGGASHTIASGDPTKVVLSPSGLFNEATPSALAANGRSFNDCAYAQKCPTP